MSSQLIPSPELAPPSVKHLPLDKTIQLWAELVDESEALLVAGLRARVGPGGDYQQADRDWYARYTTDDNRMIPRMAKNSLRRGATNGK